MAMSTPTRTAGFTLVELMVTLALMAMLLLLAMPFTQRWSESNRQMQARSVLWDGVGRARAVAMRNAGQLPANEAAAVLKLVDGELQVQVSGSGDTVWKSELNKKVTLKLADKAGAASAEFSCVAFNSRGLRLPLATDCSQDVASLGRIAVELGSLEALYVDML